jgi:hypothetical protein
MVHRIVAEQFLGPCPEGREVNHKDGNKQNNCAWNLEYVTGNENHRHASKAGLKTCGENHPHSKLSADAVGQIRKLSAQGFRATVLAKMYGVSVRNIYGIKSGEFWVRSKKAALSTGAGEKI